MKTYNWEGVNPDGYFLDKLEPIPSALPSFQIVPSTGNRFINTMKSINHTRSSISDDIRNILCSSVNRRRAIELILRLLLSEAHHSTNLESHFLDWNIGKILNSSLSWNKHVAN